MYLLDMINDMTVTPFYFDGISMQSSKAYYSGGGVYYTESSQSLV
jgi:hypothetical protein